MPEYTIDDSTTLKIVSDDDPQSPREWDNLGTMICFHKRYKLGDKHEYKPNDYNGWDEQHKQITKDFDAAVILPLYLYDHSGITIATTPFNCRWDSGQVGWIVVSKKIVRSEYGIKRITKNWIDKITFYLKNEVEVYDQYLRGDTYGFELVKDDEVVDSCWGFYGSDLKMNGILGHLTKEQKEIVLAQL